MKAGCDCSYCKNKVDEYLCISCGYNFNECESFHKSKGMILCPKCHPADKFEKLADDLHKQMDTIYSKVEIDRSFDPNITACLIGKSTMMKRYKKEGEKVIEL
jgi:hypothetical protein